MERSHWYRLLVIATLFLGSAYVLLPTLFQVDPNQDKAEEIKQSTDSGEKFEREVVLTVVSGDAEALRTALEARYRAAGVAIDGVLVANGDVVVRRKVQVTDDEIRDGLKAGHEVRIIAQDVELVGFEDPGTAIGWASLDAVRALEGQAPADPSAAAKVASVQGSTLVLAEPFTGPGPFVITVDGVIRAVALPDPVEAGEAFTASGTWAGLGGYGTLAADLELESLPGELEWNTVSTEIDQAAIEGEAAESSIPEWMLEYIPDTRMPLGLDLQGGVDLTLQVELNEALLSQVNRDLTFLRTDAAKHERGDGSTGLEITEAKRDKYEPAMLIQTTDSVAELQRFITKSFGIDYELGPAMTGDDGATWQRFDLSAARSEEIKDRAISQVLDVLRKRVAETKVRDPVVVRKGGGKVSVQLPGLADTKAAVSAIGRAAVLEFKLVDPEFNRGELERIYADARNRLPETVFNDDALLNEWLAENEMLPEGMEMGFEYEAVIDETTEEKTMERARPYPLQAKTILSGQDVNGAEVGFDPQTTRPYVSLEFKPKGSTVFCDFTGEHVDDQFAIIHDGVIQSEPTIKEKICGGRAQITMGSSIDAQNDARALAVVLRTGSLDAPVSIGSVRQIGPSLGEAAIQAGSIATILGGVIVLVFMVFWYRGPGLIANVALVLNILLMLAGLSLFGWTLTLPGIAGIALTVGMAVDANIIIYERIREELKMGQHARKAVETGFQKAAVAVLDANITTAIAGVVLFSYGNVTIQGFAVTLLMGIGTTLFTALFVTRSLLVMVTRRATARLRI